MVNFIFSWLNFGIFILICRLVYRRFFKERLALALEATQDKIRALQQEVSSLESQVREVAVDLVLQENETADLLAKVKRWQTEFELVRQVELKNCALIQSSLLDQNEVKMQNLSLNAAQKELLTAALVEVSSVLSDKFKKKTDTDKYLCRVLDRLDRG